MTDWSVLELEGLQDEVRKAAGSVAAMYPTFCTAEDLEQEAYIYCATNPDWVRKCHAKKDKLLGVSIWRALQHVVRTEASRQEQTIGIHRLYEMAE